MNEENKHCAILVLDDYPKHCEECFWLYGGCQMKKYATSIDELNSQRDRYCPMQSVEDMLEDITNDDFDSEEYKRGFKDCLDEIVSDWHVKFD